MLRKTGLLTALLLTLYAPSCGTADRADQTDRAAESRLDSLYAKDSVTIVVTDSGLGGISVMAAVERMLQQYRVFSNVRLIFVNALPDREHLYNRMESLEEKSRVFDSALTGMERNFKPDVILIACNTLSVVFPHTAFSRSSTVPVISIVEFGVDPVAGELRGDSTAHAVILGTPTTIAQNTHAARLAELGFDSTRVVSQACEMLESEIQADPNSDIVRTMIEMYASEALEKAGEGQGSLIVTLCCSHYGFARSAFQSVFEALTDRPVRIVDPNIGMGEFLFPPEVRNRHAAWTVAVGVVSRTEIPDEELAAIAGAIRPVSAATADAVASYILDTTLFSF